MMSKPDPEPEPDIFALKQTLYAQKHLIQKLYNELDAEREASATAATETLSVILRLQREKAAAIIEAKQYERLSEEKISHAKETLALFQDIIHHKELEVAALHCQAQAYRYKLLSMGYVDHRVVHDVFEVDHNFDYLEMQTQDGERSKKDEEVEMLLNEIEEKVSLLHHENENRKGTNASTRDDESLLSSLAEVISED